MTHPATRWLFLLLMSAVTFVGGCGDSAAGPAVDGTKDAEDISANQRRIVSLSPALTRMVVDLGKAHTLVGVGDNDAAAPTELSLASVGPYPNVNSEILISLKPTHVLIMAGEDGIPDSLQGLASSHDFELVSFEYPSSVIDVVKILMGEFSEANGTVVSDKSLGGALGDELIALTLGSGISQTLGEIGTVTDTIPYDKKPRVLVVFQTTPRYMAAGPKTVLHDLLTQYCRAENAAIPALKAPKDIYNSAEVKRSLEDPAKHVGTAPTFDKERMLEANPDVILMLLPGEPPLGTIDDDPRLLSLRGLDIPAVKNNRIILISDPMALLPSSSLPSTAFSMAKAIHPQLADQLDRVIAVRGETTSETPGEKTDETQDNSNSDQDSDQDESGTPKAGHPNAEPTDGPVDETKKDRLIAPNTNDSPQSNKTTAGSENAKATSAAVETTKQKN